MTGWIIFGAGALVILGAAGWFVLARRTEKVFWPVPGRLDAVGPSSLLTLSRTFVTRHLQRPIEDVAEVDEGVWDLTIGQGADRSTEPSVVRVVHRSPNESVGVTDLRDFYETASNGEAWMITNGTYTRRARNDWSAEHVRLVTGTVLEGALSRTDHDLPALARFHYNR